MIGRADPWLRDVLAASGLLVGLAACGCGGEPAAGGDPAPFTAAIPVPDSGTFGPRSIPLSDGWKIQSSREVAAPGAEVARAGFATAGWIDARIPSTVVGAQVAAGRLPDPDVGMNLRDFPGMDYPVHGSFSFTPMAAESPYSVPWWYRVELPAQPDLAGRRAWLRFDGINQRADVWLNGVQLASADRTQGAFRVWEFEVSGVLRGDGANALAVRVVAPQVGELSWNWVDWNPSPPDKNMGLTGAVTLVIAGPVRLRDPLVVTHLESLDEARLTVIVEAQNAGDGPLHTTVAGDIEGRGFSRELDLAPGETRKLVFRPEEYPALVVAHPKLWWPNGLGAPELHPLALVARVAGAISDEAALQFGIREVSTELTPEGHRLFRVNGQKVLIRGAGYAPDLLLRQDPRRMEDEIRYVRGMNLNAIRLEGKLGLAPLYDLCDRYGILVIAGVCCCDRWEMFSYWDVATRDVAVASIADQTRALRAHASALAWLNGSDGHPPPEIEQLYLDALTANDWPNAIVLSAGAGDSPLTGPSGVKMVGPYTWVPPIFWYQDRILGGAFGFNTETSQGAAVPPLESLKRFLPPEHLWPIDDFWTFHAVNSTGADLWGFTGALAARYGGSPGVEDFARKAQLDTYEGVRAMFEAFGRNKYLATGVIQWMLNSAWPSVVWHLYGSDLAPAGGYFGARKACEPLHVQYSYDDRSVVVVNSTRSDEAGLTARADLYEQGGALVWSGTRRLDARADTSGAAFALPDPPGVRGAYLARLELVDGAGASRSLGWYWLSTTPDQLGAESVQVNPPPVARYADFTALSAMPPGRIDARAARSAAVDGDGADEIVEVTLANPGPGLAFFVRARIVRADTGAEILPVRWDDDFVTLAPHERRTLHARYRTGDRAGAAPSLRVDGWNVAAVSVPVAP